MRWLPLLLLASLLAACGSVPRKPAPGEGGSSVSRPGARPAAPSAVAGDCLRPYAPAQEDPAKRGNYVSGGLYAPNVPDSTPDYVPNLACIPEPRVVDEPRSAIGNRTPYSVLGKQYHVMDRPHGYAERGLASYYGNKFHGRLTSNREVYDMYAYTAAHKTLPLPSFARVTNLDNGRSVVVRVNDRGPFHDGRVIDLSYAAAVKLDIVRLGTGRVEVQALTTEGDGGSLLASAAPVPAVLAAAPAAATIPAAAPAAAAAPSAAGGASAMDQLVGRLPASGTPVASAGTTVAAADKAAGAPTPAPVATATATQPWRYHASAQPGQIASADQFETWMKSRGVRVATGRPGAPMKTDAQAGGQPGPVPGPAPAPAPGAAASGGAPTVASAASDTSAAPAGRPAVGAADRPASSATAAASAPAPSQAPGAATAARQDRPAGAVSLQVASFASRENADRALARLVAAGIAGANLSSTQRDGRSLWRLRVGPLERSLAAELVGRIAGLGLGTPQFVDD